MPSYPTTYFTEGTAWETLNVPSRVIGIGLRGRKLTVRLVHVKDVAFFGSCATLAKTYSQSISPSSIGEDALALKAGENEVRVLEEIHLMI